MTESIEKTIDIEQILRGKMGSKYRYVPRFLVSWLRRIVHEDEVNAFLWEHRAEEGTEWLESCVRYLDARLEITGRENLPPKDDGKRYVFVSNHPLGGADGVSLGAIIGRHYDGNFLYLVNDLLLNLPGLRPVSVGINKTGHQGRRFPELVESAFQSDSHIIMFPAGLCSRKINGQIHDLPWKKTFVSKAVEYQRDVVPIHFSGQNSERFYRIANICARLHLKVNIAMLFLVDEMYRNVHKTFRVAIGKPIPWQTFTKDKSPRQWAQEVEELVYRL